MEDLTEKFILLLKNKDYKSINWFFKINSSYELQTDQLEFPWNKLMATQIQFIKNRNFYYSKKVLSFYNSLDYPEMLCILRTIIKNCLFFSTYFDVNDILQFFIRKNFIDGIIFMFNASCYLFITHDKKDLLCDLYELVTDIEPISKNIDFYIFSYYCSVIHVYKGDFSKGFHLITTAMQSTRLREYILQDYLYLSFFGKNFPENDNLPIINIIRKGLVRRIYDFIPHNSLLYKQCLIYLPLICCRNLIISFHQLYDYPNKINLDEILYVLDLPKGEVYNLILNCIDRVIIKGYLSIEKNVLVLSKTNPFPDLI